MKIIIVEDEKELSNSIKSYLLKEGYLIEQCFNISGALDKICTNKYDFALIDLMLPDGNGISLIEEIKKLDPKCGIIIISAKESLDDKIKGLEIGADDYITKPFHLAELNARIKSLFRRKIHDGNSKIIFNELTIEFDKREFFVNDKPVDLTKREFDLLMFLVNNKERALTKEAITEHVWGDNSSAFDNFDFVYTHIKNLRKKLRDYGAGDYIKSVYGFGYKFSLK
jgi:DNA-binding response OmpR family regulator